MWLERMSFFQENSRIIMNWRTGEEEGQEEGLVKYTRLDNLQLGARYEVSLREAQSNVTTSFNFSACKFKLHKPNLLMPTALCNLQKKGCGNRKHTILH